MKLFNDVLDLIDDVCVSKIDEGGLVKIPIGLQKKVIGGAKSIIMGQVLSSVIGVISAYNLILKKLDNKNPNRKIFVDIVDMLDKYVSRFKSFKPRKSNVRNKKIRITDKDMKPYDIGNHSGFDILLSTTTVQSKGTSGPITTRSKDIKFEDEIPLSINFSRIGGTIDLFKSFSKNAANLFMMVRDNKPLSDNSLNMLKTVFPEFKKFQKDISKEMEEAISIIRHELTHVIQVQTGKGFNHSDFNKEGGVIQLKGKSQGAYDKYAASSVEVKAYLSTQVDSFYAMIKDGADFNTAVKSFVSNRTWFDAFKDIKKKNKVIRDFVIALKNDRRLKKIGISKLKLESFYEKKDTTYQTYEYPISIADVKDTYNRFNKDLFGGKLPKVRLKWAPLAKNFYGKYHHVYDTDGNKAKDRLITLATILQKDNELFEDILIHEMIHTWQYYMEEKTGNSKYIDHVWFDPETDMHKRGHGPFFFGEMKRINKLGYNVTREGDLQIEKELIKPVYAIIFNSSSERGVFVYSIKDPKDKIDIIIASLEDIAGTGFFTSYTIIKTTDTVANTGLRLTKAFVLPKNSQNIYIASNDIRTYLSKSKLSSIVGGDDLGPSGEFNQAISPDETQLLSRMHKWRGGDFKSYLITFLNNINKYSALIATDAYKAKNWASQLSIDKYEYGKEIKGIPKVVVDAVRNDWVNVSDLEIKSVFKFASTEINRVITSSDKKVSDKYITGIKKKFDNDFSGRVSIDRFKDAYYKVVLSDIKKKHKKFNKPFNSRDIENVIRNVILKGTFLEHKLINRVMHDINCLNEGSCIDGVFLDKNI